MPNIFGLSFEGALLVIAFWFSLSTIVFGIERLQGGDIPALTTFLSFGSIVVIGKFGWQILIIPSLAVIIIFCFYLVSRYR